VTFAPSGSKEIRRYRDNCTELLRATNSLLLPKEGHLPSLETVQLQRGSE
jgi:hypothetical protein